jgi:two-component system sensor histidine kinase QseC
VRLQWRVVLIAGVSLVLLWLAAAAWMMQGARANLDRTLDGRLAMSARMVAGLLERSALSPHLVDDQLLAPLRVSGNDGIACEIRSLRGEVLARTTTSPPSAFESLPVGFSTRLVDGKAWRVYVMRAGPYQITTADQVAQRHALVDELLRAAAFPFLIALLGGLAALWVGTGRGLAPLKTLCSELRERDANDTSAIALARPPQELRTVLDAINGWLGRLARTLSSQRAFTDAAAHELRTPLTVIDTHLQLVRMSEPDEARAALDHAEEGVRRLRRTLDQMMVLARTEASVAEACIAEGEGCSSVREAVQTALEPLAPLARQRIALVLRGADRPSPVPRSMLEAAVRNLVDNGLRYSAEGAAVDVALRLDEVAHRFTVVVADRGPGLSDKQVAQLGQRFWRGDQGRQRSDGSGLGISIVRSIALRFGGSLQFRPREGGGLVAEIVLPLRSDAR